MKMAVKNKAFVVERKKRFVLRKCKRRWVVKSLLFGSVIFSSSLTFSALKMKAVSKDEFNGSQASLLIEFLAIFLPTQVSAATYNTTIDMVKDVSIVTPPHAATFSNGTSNTNTGATLWQNGGSSNGGTFPSSTVNLTNNDSTSDLGTVTFQNQVDWTQDFSITVTIGIDSSYGDGTGLIFAPQLPPNQLTSGVGGAGLGLWGLKNAIGLIIDDYANDGTSTIAITNPNMGDFTNGAHSSIILGSADGDNAQKTTSGTYSNGMSAVPGNANRVTANGGATSSASEQYISWRYTDANGKLVAIDGANTSTTYTLGAPTSAGNAVASVNKNATSHQWTVTYTASTQILQITDNNNQVTSNGSIQNQYFGANTDAKTWVLNVNSLWNNGAGTPTAFGFVGSDSSGSGNKFTVATSAYNLPLSSTPIKVNYTDTNGKTIQSSNTIKSDIGLQIGINQTLTTTTAIATDDAQGFIYNAPMITGYIAYAANDVTATNPNAVNASNTQNVSAVLPNTFLTQTMSYSQVANDSSPLNIQTLASPMQTTAINQADNTLTIVYEQNVQTTVLFVDENGSPITDSNGNLIAPVLLEGYQTQELGDTPNYATIAQVEQQAAQAGYSKAIGTYTTNTESGTAVDLSSTQLQANGTSPSITGTDGATMYFAGTTYYVVLQGDAQQAQLTSSVSPSTTLNPMPSTIETTNGTSKSSITFKTTDDDLTQAGYTYTVTGPDNTIYPTLSAALVANPNYDQTENGAKTTDGIPQIFTVNYTADTVTIQYGFVDLYGNITTVVGSLDVTNQIQSEGLDTLSSNSLTIGQTLTSTLANNAQSNPSDVTVTFLNNNLLPDGYQLTGTVYWNNNGTSLPTSTTTLSAGANDTNVNVMNNATDYQGLILFQYEADFQQINVMIDYMKDDGTTINTMANDSVVTQTNGNITSSALINGEQSISVTGQTKETYTVDVQSCLASGYYLDSNQTIDGVFDDTNNATLSDSGIQTTMVQARPSQQILDITYENPDGTSANVSVQSWTNEPFALPMTPQIDGYLPIYTVEGKNATSNMPTIIADNTNNGDNSQTQTDLSHQTMSVSYTADFQAAKIVVDAQNAPSQYNENLTVETQDGVTDVPILFQTTDATLMTQGYDYQINAPNGQTYDTLTEAIKANPTYDDTNNTGGIDSAEQIFTVVYTPWTATMIYYVKNQAANLLTEISTTTGLLGTDFTTTYGGNNEEDYTSLTNTFRKTVLIDGTMALPQGYHVSDCYWSDTLSGTTVEQDPPYTTNWTWEDTTNQTASIVYVYEGDTQEAQVVLGASSPKPTGLELDSLNNIATSSGMTNQAITFTVNDSALTQIGYTYKVTGVDGTVYATLAQALSATPTYDDTNTYPNTDESLATQQIFTVNYTADPVTIQ